MMNNNKKIQTKIDSLKESYQILFKEIEELLYCGNNLFKYLEEEKYKLKMERLCSIRTELEILEEMKKYHEEVEG